MQKALTAAREADVAVIFAGLPDIFESEGYDRKSMKMPDCQNRLIEAVVEVQPNVVVVLHNGSPIEAPWADKVAAVLELYLGGQGVGEACDRLLYGEANPSGRLAETFPLRIEDNPSYLNFPGDGKHVDYAEGIYVGYRYYEAKNLPVRWTFGHGLSYTEYTYSNLRLSDDRMNDESCVTVSVDVTNTGKMAGKEVVQLYVSDKNATSGRPVKELKGFKKVALQPGETATVSMEVSARDLSYYEEAMGDWYAPAGTYEISVGHASNDIRLAAEVSFETKKMLPFTVTPETTLGELLKNPATAPVASALLEKMTGGAPADEVSEADAALIDVLLNETPLKSLVIFGVPGEQIDALVAQMAALCKE